MRLNNFLQLIQEKVLYEINSNSALRENVFSYKIGSEIINLNNLESVQHSQRKEISLFITNAINIPTIDYNYTVCNQDNLDCAPDFLDPGNTNLYISLPSKNIYAKSIMIADATRQRVFRLYLWETF